MSVLRWSTPVDEIADRIGARLRAGTRGTPRVVAWERDGRRLLLLLYTLRVSVRDGWLLVDLTVQTEPTGPRVLQLVFFLGADGDGDGTHAGGTIHAEAREGAQLADVWGDDLQRVVWDGVLDIVEGSVELSAQRTRGAPQNLLGFSCSDGLLHVDVQAGGS